MELIERMMSFPGMEEFLEKYAPDEQEDRDSFFDKLESIAMRRELMDLLTREGAEPDTHGSWSVFVRFFICEEMRESFVAAARVFLRHESDCLDDYNRSMYFDPFPGQEVYRDRVNKQVLSMMVRAVQSGNDFTKNLLILLYKTFFKKEYKALRRFRTINYGEVHAFVDDSVYESDKIDTLSRVICMCMVMGISFHPDCNVLFSMLNLYEEWMFYREDELSEFQELSDASLKQGEQWVREQTEQIIPKKSVKYYYAPDDAEEYMPYRAAAYIIQTELAMQGFDPEYAWMIGEDIMPVETGMAQVYAMLKEGFPDEEFSFRDIQMLEQLLELVRGICDYEREIDDIADKLLYTFSGSDENEDDILTNDLLPDWKRTSANDEIKKTAVKQSISGDSQTKRTLVTRSKEGEQSQRASDPLPDEFGYPKEAKWIEEIRLLRDSLHTAKENEKRARRIAAEAQRKNEEQKGIIVELEDQKKELAALREYVYQLTEQDDSTSEDSVSISQMKDELSEKRVAIIGGHSNWVRKLKQEFPGWTFLSPKVSGSIETKLVIHMDKVYFFTDTIAHSTYYRFINIVRESKVDFGYIHGINIERNIRQIYRDLCKND